MCVTHFYSSHWEARTLSYEVMNAASSSADALLVIATCNTMGAVYITLTVLLALVISH